MNFTQKKITHFIIAIRIALLAISCDDGTGTDEILNGGFLAGPAIETAQAVSATSVKLIFDQFMSPEGADFLSNYTITDGSGNNLTLENIELDSTKRVRTVMLTTGF